uniref:Uncharacterized protein n=1 Tax=Anguilla anguilla TaxID=7936 RepID=A0A0E9R0K7_ANGAN
MGTTGINPVTLGYKPSSLTIILHCCPLHHPMCRCICPHTVYTMPNIFFLFKCFYNAVCVCIC